MLCIEDLVEKNYNQVVILKPLSERSMLIFSHMIGVYETPEKQEPTNHAI